MGTDASPESPAVLIGEFDPQSQTERGRPLDEADPAQPHEEGRRNHSNDEAPGQSTPAGPLASNDDQIGPQSNSVDMLLKQNSRSSMIGGGGFVSDSARRSRSSVPRHQSSTMSMGPPSSMLPSCCLRSSSLEGLSSSSSGSTSFLTKLSTHRTLPKITFGRRPKNGSIFSVSENPGPGRYVNDKVDVEKQSRCRSTPAFNFGRGSDRFRPPRPSGAGELGPGAYGLPRDASSKFVAEVQHGIGNAKRQALWRSSDFPTGPGMYKIPSTLSTQAFSANGKYRKGRRNKAARPGPGTYNPSIVAAEFKYEHVGANSFSRSIRLRDPHQDVRPGPGAYDVCESMPFGGEKPKYSLMSRPSYHNLEPYMLPGPGMYGAQTSFGY